MHDILFKTLWMYGLAIVVSLLIAVVIKAIVGGLNAFERLSLAKAAPQPAAPMAELAPGVSADHVAAIVAAVYATIGAHRIVHIDDGHRAAGWVNEGRRAHHASHDIERLIRR